jgi:uncharacterized protein (TIGR02687 family)
MSMTKNALQNLEKLFEANRIVIWYDGKCDFLSDYDELTIPGVEKIKVSNNEFSVKYRIFYEDRNGKYLIYCPFEKPQIANNWLLDVEISCCEFTTDKALGYVMELGWDRNTLGLVNAHIEFFKPSRITLLQKVSAMNPHANKEDLLLSCLCKQKDGFNFDDMITKLLYDFVKGSEDLLNSFKVCNLEKRFWDLCTEHFGFSLKSPTVKDLALQLISTDFYSELDTAKVKLNNDARNYVQQMKDSKQDEDLFRKLSSFSFEEQNYKAIVENYHTDDLMNVDTFDYVERRILESIFQSINMSSTIYENTRSRISTRMKSFWYSDYKTDYESLLLASRFYSLLNGVNYHFDNIKDSAFAYVKHYYELDMVYRQFMYSSRSGHFSGLRTDINARYKDDFMVPINSEWNSFVHKYQNLSASSVGIAQRSFFDNKIKPFLVAKSKIVVIISDALRYEVGKELATRIQQKDMFVAEVSPMFATIPSYTQLGMAALLPHSTLTVNDSSPNATVLADDKDTNGLANRKKLLTDYFNVNYPEKNVTAVKIEDIENATTDDLRNNLVRNNDLVYIYQDVIDDHGDDAFAACEDAIEKLLVVIRKLASANVNNIIVTADHGFLFRMSPLQQRDFISDRKVEGENVFFKDRRFFMGYSLIPNNGVEILDAEELRLKQKPGFQVAVPNATLCFRYGSTEGRYVHGGASLQELVIPIVEINKKRKSDTSFVDVSFMAKLKAVTTNQIEIVAVQDKPVSEKQKPVSVQCYIASGDDESSEKLSAVRTLVFDAESTDTRERTRTETFYLNEASKNYNGKMVHFIARKILDGSSETAPYSDIEMTIRRAFDFDEF